MNNVYLQIIAIAMIIAFLCFLIFYICSAFSKRALKRVNLNILYEGKDLEGINFVDENCVNKYTYSEDDKKLKLNAKEIKQKTFTHKWAVVIHGHKRDYKFVSKQGKSFFEEGYNILLPNLRGHGESEGNIATLGILDCNDIANWCNLILEEDKDAQIVLYGISMGAATVMNTAGLNLEFNKNIIAVIEDCGFTSPYKQVQFILTRDYPFPKEMTMLLINLYTKIKYGLDLKSVKPIESIKNTNVPILFIHGNQDLYIPPFMAEELYESYKGPKEIIMVNGAEHATSIDVIEEEYFEKIFNFLEKFKN